MYDTQPGVPNVSISVYTLFYTALPTGDILHKTSTNMSFSNVRINLQRFENEHTSHNKIPVSHPLTNLIPPSGNT